MPHDITGLLVEGVQCVLIDGGDEDLPICYNRRREAAVEVDSPVLLQIVWW
jgi:hypothetical protein